MEIQILNYLRQDRLMHPNIIRMWDFFDDGHNFYIEMIPISLLGTDLFDLIETRDGISEKESRRIFIQLTNAIHHLHLKALIVHRDIKDENVVVYHNGITKLIDFGGAAYIERGPFTTFVGTMRE